MRWIGQLAHRGSQDSDMTIADLSIARSLLPDFDASPTPYHAVETVARRLAAAGFTEHADSDPIEDGPKFWCRGGALLAWVIGGDHDARSPLRIIGAHTDSPNLRIKPNPDRTTARFGQLGVEVYGGALLNSWLDRDLGLAGRVALRGQSGPEMATFRDDRAILRVPQLAIHLDGNIRESGLVLNKQRHMVPVWGLDPLPSFRQYLSDQTGAAEADILSWDVMAHDLCPASLGGLNEEFLLASRIDNQLSCFLAARAIEQAATALGSAIPIIALFDHEEVGSVSTTGAASPLVANLVAQIADRFGATPGDVSFSRSTSLVVSADGAHATHPNYPDRHEPDHQIGLNAGPVLKVNANQRYATDAYSAARLRLAAERVGAPLQTFVSRTDLACGSTIGPATAGELGIDVVDVGCPQLAMHSAREMAGSHDPAAMLDLLAEVLTE